MRRTVATLLMSGASALWVAAAIATLFASPQYARHYADLRQDPRVSGVAGLVLVGAAVVMVAAAAAGVVVAVAGTAVIVRVFAVPAGVVAVLVVVVGVPGGVVWHARLMTAAAVLTLVLLAAAVVLQSPRARGAAPVPRVPTPVPAGPAVSAPVPGSPGPVPGASAPVPAASAPVPAASTSVPAESGPGSSGGVADAGSPPREPFRRWATRRDVPRWAMAPAAIAAVVFAITAGLLAVREEDRARAPSAGPTASPAASAEPPHDVVYMVTAPSDVTWLEVVYLDALGKDQRVSPPTGGPTPWIQTIRTGPDTDLIYLAASVAGATRNPKIQCAVFIDGKRAIASEGPSCTVHVRFPR